MSKMNALVETMHQFTVDSGADSACLELKSEVEEGCPFLLHLEPSFEEIMSMTTKKALSDSNLLLMRFAESQFCVLEEEMLRKCFPAKKIFELVLEQIKGLRVLFCGTYTGVRVRNLSKVPIQVHTTKDGKQVSLTLGATVDLVHGSVVTIQSFGQEEEHSYFPPLQYRVIHVRQALGPEDSWYANSMACLVRSWSSEAPPPKEPRFSLRMSRKAIQLKQEELEAMSSTNLLSIPCGKLTAVGRDQWAKAFPGRFRNFAIRHMPHCIYLLRWIDENMELLNCCKEPLQVCDRKLKMGESCRVQHGDHIFVNFEGGNHKLPLGYVVVDSQAKFSAEYHNYINVEQLKTNLFTPLIDRMRWLAQNEQQIQFMYQGKPISDVALCDDDTDTPIALMPIGGGNFELELYWRHPCLMGLQKDKLQSLNMLPDRKGDLFVTQLLGIAAINEGSKTIEDHEGAHRVCTLLARGLGVDGQRILPQDYFIAKMAQENLAFCYPQPGAP